MSNSPSPIKAVAYARVSTLLGQDPENQLTHIRQFAQVRQMNLIQEFVDQGISGAKERRPSLDEMIKQAKQGKFKIIVVAAIDRLARDTRHMLNLISELSHSGVSIISLRENIDFSTPMGQAALTIFAAVAQLERQLISERIKNALAAKKLAAQKSGASWRAGRPTVLNTDLILKVQECRNSGLSIRAIAKKLGVSKTTVQRALESVPVTSSPTAKKDE